MLTARPAPTSAQLPLRPSSSRNDHYHLPIASPPHPPPQRPPSGRAQWRTINIGHVHCGFNSLMGYLTSYGSYALVVVALRVSCYDTSMTGDNIHEKNEAFDNQANLVNYDNENEKEIDDLGYQSEEYIEDAHEDDENNHSNGYAKRGITRLCKFRREYGKPME
ncbi:hypothetical protein Tco_0968487 [Tanacetum coccineum]